MDRERHAYRIRFEKSLIASLSIAVLAFTLSRRFPETGTERRLPGFSLTSVDMMPRTQQGSLRRPPDLPKMPVPVEDEYLPEDETIEDTRFELFEDIPLFDGIGDVQGGSRGIGPRPIREVIPEYPEDEQKRGREGVVELNILVNSLGLVDSVQVVQNTTGSAVLARSAVQAAYKSRYMPATRDGRQVPNWIRRPFRFSRK